jgi:hypothetical protein
MSKYRFQILLIILGIIAIACALFITPTFATKFLLSEQNISLNGLKILNYNRIISSVFGILLIICGSILLTVKNLDEHLLRIWQRSSVGGNWQFKWESLVLISICLIGLFLRLYFYVINRSLWIDEASLALNIVNRSFFGLLKPLDNNQGAPIGFLLFTKAIVSLFGISDFALRLLPLLAGLVSIPLMYFVSRKYVKGLASFVSLGLFALSTQLIYYSSEFKQYSSDVLMTLFLLFIFPKCLEDQKKPVPLIIFGIVGTLAMWISQPIIFIFVGCFLTLALDYSKRKDLYHQFWLIGSGGVWGINFLVNYLYSLRSLSTNSSLLSYWSFSFAPLPPWSDLGWYFNALIKLLSGTARLPITLITIGLLLLGIISIASRKWQFTLVLTLPFLLTLIASALRKYPFSGRLLLFLIPLLLLLLSEGIERVRSLLMQVNRPLAYVVSFLFVTYLFFTPIHTAGSDVLNPPMREDIKPVMSYVNKNYLSDDLIYIYYGAGPAIEFYAPQYGFINKKFIVGLSARNDPSKYLQEIDNFKGNQRVWIIFSHNCDWCIVNEQEYILDHLNMIGVKRSEFNSGTASVYLYDMTVIP